MSAGFKGLAKIGVATGRTGGIAKTGIMSPDKLRTVEGIAKIANRGQKFYDYGGTILKFGKYAHIDVSTKSLLHLHLWFTQTHLPLGTILAGNNRSILMGKIKISKNKKVMAFDAYSNLLDKDRLYNLCKLFNLQDIYMDIYTVDIRKKNFHEILIDSKICEKIFCAPSKQLQDVYIKIAINNLPVISNLLCQFVFEDLIIWDCYTSWEKYLEDKTAKQPFFTIKPIKVENDGKFYLNYNPGEGQKVEIICELAYDSQKLTTRLNDLLNLQK